MTFMAIDRLHATRIKCRNGGRECEQLCHLLTAKVSDISTSETDIDDVLQISNIFTNVSKGEVAKNGDLQKAFGKTDRDEIVREVC